MRALITACPSDSVVLRQFLRYLEDFASTQRTSARAQWESSGLAVPGSMTQGAGVPDRKETTRVPRFARHQQPSAGLTPPFVLVVAHSELDKSILLVPFDLISVAGGFHVTLSSPFIVL